MPEGSGIITGVGLGTLLWNGIILSLAAIGVISGETAWLCIQGLYGLAAGWVLLLGAATLTWP